MIIAVNTRYLSDDDPEGRGDFIFEIFSRLAKKCPQHQFIYIFDKAYDEKFITSKNITPVVTGPEARSPLRRQYWYNYKVPAILKKYKATIFVSTDGICSLRTKLPQCLLLHDLAFLHYPRFFAKNQLRYYKKFTPQFLAKAKTIATVSSFVKKDIIERYAIDPGKISVVDKAPRAVFQPLDEKEKEIIKEKYSEGKEYFLYPGSIDAGKNMLNILKAFSFFKKRQKSNMLLLIAGSEIPGKHQFTEDLKTFKFRSEVNMLGDLSIHELAKVTAAAYAMLYPVFLEDFTSPVLESMQSEVPMIAGNTASLPGPCAAVTLNADPGDFMDIAEKMMLLFKDEHKRNELIHAGKSAVQQYNGNNTADLLWQCICKAIE